MHDLIERPDLGHPVTFKLAVVILADLARHGARRLHHVAECAGFYGVGSQFIDHDVSPSFLLLVLYVALRSPDAAQRVSGALLIRGPSGAAVGPGSAVHRKTRCTASGTRDLLS